MPDEIVWKGSDEELQQLGEAIAQFSNPRFMRDFIQDVADEVLKMIRAEFTVSKDPYGTPWDPRKTTRTNGKLAKTGSHKVLWKSGSLRASIKRRLNMDGFAIYSDSPYFKYHQFGTKRMPRRLIFPVSGVSDVTDKGIIEGPLDVESTFDIIMLKAIQKVLSKMDLDPFQEEGGVAMFERSRSFRDDY